MEDIRSTKRRSNLFVVLAIVAAASAGAAVPHGVALHRDLDRLNNRLLELQTSIVANQRETMDVQAKILRVQAELEKRGAR